MWSRFILHALQITGAGAALAEHTNESIQVSLLLRVTLGGWHRLVGACDRREGCPFWRRSHSFTGKTHVYCLFATVKNRAIAPSVFHMYNNSTVGGRGGLRRGFTALTVRKLTFYALSPTIDNFVPFCTYSRPPALVQPSQNTLLLVLTLDVAPHIHSQRLRKQTAISPEGDHSLWAALLSFAEWMSTGTLLQWARCFRFLSIVYHCWPQHNRDCILQEIPIQL